MAHSVVAQFSIAYSQYLDPDGKAAADIAEAGVTTDLLLRMLKGLWRARRFDSRAIALQRTGLLGTYAAGIGQEAIGVGVAAAMTAEDVLVPSYRDSAAQLWRGVTMRELLLYWGGDERGSTFAAVPQDFPICVTVGDQPLHAVGAAYALRQQRKSGVAVSISGDGSTSKGEFYEGLNFAGVWKVPAIFVVNNNQWAISVPRAMQSAAQTLAQKAIAAGIPGMQVDGNDVIAVYAAMGLALQRARIGEGPTLIEALSYRLSDHTTADDATRYRTPAEVQTAWQKEPIRRLTTYLTAQGAWSKAQEDALLAEIDGEIEAAVGAYKATPPQAPETMFDYLYATLPGPLAEQRAACIGETVEAKPHG